MLPVSLAQLSATLQVYKQGIVRGQQGCPKAWSPSNDKKVTSSNVVRCCDGAGTECQLHQFGQHWLSDQAATYHLLRGTPRVGVKMSWRALLHPAMTEPRRKRHRRRPRDVRHAATPSQAMATEARRVLLSSKPRVRKSPLDIAVQLRRRRARPDR